MYGGDDFEKDVKDYIEMVNRECSVSDDVIVEKMQYHFNMCCKLEYMFWDQASVCMGWPAIK
jgi:thiaminase